jgi:hypothetical protein
VTEQDCQSGYETRDEQQCTTTFEQECTTVFEQVNFVDFFFDSVFIQPLSNLNGSFSFRTSKFCRPNIVFSSLSFDELEVKIV